MLQAVNSHSYNMSTKRHVPIMTFELVLLVHFAFLFTSLMLSLCVSRICKLVTFSRLLWLHKLGFDVYPLPMSSDCWSRFHSVFSAFLHLSQQWLPLVTLCTESKIPTLGAPSLVYPSCPLLLELQSPHILKYAFQSWINLLSHLTPLSCGVQTKKSA